MNESFDIALFLAVAGVTLASLIVGIWAGHLAKLRRRNEKELQG